MYLIVGLGNPGKQYDWTRHNIGFETIDKLCFDLKITLKEKKRFKAQVAQTADAIFAKPLTYMNLSGESVLSLASFYNISHEKIIIIQDEVDLPVGKIQLRKTLSAGGHNGIKNIIAHLGKDINRIRIGIGLKPKQILMADYVLSKFFKEEHEAIINSVTIASEAALYILKNGIDKAMNEFNPT
ncbi:MAG: aminoacyl-tRNA hydrolase [Defluviitaleaceae bacterium]|nr:aminoacyl-tRNA hydrolase [Defluviitaleaceae bacterium]